MTHPAVALDDTIHQRVRLGILAVLQESRRADFAYLREALELTDGNLSQHLRVLEEGGYIEIAKTFEGRKPRTCVSATRAVRAGLLLQRSPIRLGQRDDKRRGSGHRQTSTIGVRPQPVLSRSRKYTAVLIGGSTSPNGQSRIAAERFPRKGSTAGWTL